jgi:hypothetical protein
LKGHSTLVVLNCFSLSFLRAARMAIAIKSSQFEHRYAESASDTGINAE